MLNKFLTLFIFICLLATGGCGGKQPSGPPAGTAEPKGTVAPVMTIHKQSEPVILSAMAVAEAGREAELYFNASGNISKLNVAVGDRVSKGQLLAVLDSGTPGSRSARQLDIEDARRNLARAEEELKRYQALHEAGAVSDVELDNKRQAVEDAASQLERAMISYEDTVLTAPFTGVVVEINRRVGETASPGTSVIKVADLSKIKLTLDVSGELVNSFAAGKKVKVAREDGLKSEGTITSVALLTDPATGKYPVEIEVENGRGDWRGGMTAMVEVPRALVSGIVVPLSALGIEGEKRYVLVVEKDEARKRYVEVGQVMEDQIEIVSGLKEGERVITGGIAHIFEGEKIKAKGD